MKIKLYCDARDCRHLGCGNRTAGNYYVCSAFPDGIPDDILSGKVIHTTILPGQVGGYVLKPGPRDQLPRPL